MIDDNEDYGSADSLVNNKLAADLATLAPSYKSTTVWYISPALESLVDVERISLPPFVVFFGNPTQLFKHILSMPDEFALTAESGEDLNSIPYARAFQRRTVIPGNESAALSTDESSTRVSISLDKELGKWASSVGEERPIMLLGDRGSGKTWQLLKFCEEQYARCKESPWLNPPALYLSLRHTWNYFVNTQKASLGLFGLLTEMSDWFKVKWNVTMLQALLENRQLIVCLDGLDEVEIQPSDIGVRDHLRRIVSMMPMSSRFLISCRATHFGSFADLYSLETWPGYDVENTFRLLRLLPFGQLDLLNYTSALSAAAPSSIGLAEVKQLICGEDSDPIIAGLKRCSREPGLLARIAFSPIGKNSAFGLLEDALVGTLIEFNVQHERTRPLHLDQKGELRTFDTQTRIAFLGELAWFMAERKLITIDLERLPARLSKMFGIDSEPLQRDIRSQTVFELAETLERDRRCTGDQLLALTTKGSVKFGLRLDEQLDNGRSLDITDAARENTKRHSEIRQIPQSVTESYFVASHIAARLMDSSFIPGVKLEDTLAYLGRVQLDELTGSILRKMIERNRGTNFGTGELIRSAASHIRDLARKGGCRVFTKPLRYLLQNLQLLGFLNSEGRSLIEPWLPQLSSFATAPTLLGDYEFVLVPAPSSVKLEHYGNEAGTECSNRPFFLGIHEITNAQFELFILSEPGGEWTVDKVTRAGSGGGTPASPNASLTNEYHLYFWEEKAAVPPPVGFQPPSGLLRHPVVYVSWYVAQAFCNWLSVADGRSQVFPLEENTRGGMIANNVSADGYRLPTAVEWWWSAQGSDDDATYPWELLPYPIKMSPDCEISSDPLRPGQSDAVQWFDRYRKAVNDVLLDSGRRSAEVAYDDDVGPFGAIGLIGNVKEWVQDLVVEADSNVQKAIVCGTTAHLGTNSFRIGYYATLFPENTNPDVGFRLARSLSFEEYKAFQQRESELASLSNATIETLSS